MPIFTLQEITEVKGNQKFYKLLKDGFCEFDDFETDARINYNAEMNSIYYQLDLLSRGLKLYEKKFKILKGGIKHLTECEIKSKNLRVYYFIDKPKGNIIITGGYKKNQKKDINHFRRDILKYLEFKGEQNDKGRTA